MSRRFEYEEAGSAKFWEVSLDGSRIEVRFGKLGTEGQAKVKELGSPKAAQAEAEKLVGEKTKKGYVEVKSKKATKPKVAGAKANKKDAVAALRASGQELLDTFGELALLEGGAEPAILAGYKAGEDGNTWAKVFAEIRWIAEEADGGAIGLWTSQGKPSVLYLDNEGSFTLTGPTIIDHFAWQDAAGENQDLLVSFCDDQGLERPLSPKARKAAVSGLETPEARFATLKKVDAKPATQLTAKKGPRPLSRHLASCQLSDGRIFVVTGEDFGKTYGEKITSGATFTFDPATTTFTSHPPLEGGIQAAHLVPLPGGRALLLSPFCLWADGKWASPRASALSVDLDSRVYALSDGSFVVFGHEWRKDAFRICEGQVSAIGDLPEPRSGDRMAELPDGRLWFGGGASGGSRTTRTVILDPKKWTFTQGPDLPDEPGSDNAFFDIGSGRVAFIAYDQIWIWEGKKWGSPRPLVTNADSYHRMPDRSIIGLRVEDGSVVRVDLETLLVEEVGHLMLSQTSARIHALPDGRLLFLGGTLFGNIDAEPELFDPKSGVSAALPGWEKDAERQLKALEKHREKTKKR